MNCSSAQTGTNYTVILCCLVTTNPDFVRSEIVTNGIVEWWCLRCHSQWRKACHLLFFSFVCQFSAKNTLVLDGLANLISLQYPVLPSYLGRCPYWCACLVISSEILWSFGSNAGCLVSYDTIALSTLPPTLIIPLSSVNELSDSNSPLFIRSCKLFCAYLIRNVSAFWSSSGGQWSIMKCLGMLS